MDRSRAARLVEHNIGWIRHTCKVEDWEIIVELHPELKGGNLGTCHPDSRYQSAGIDLDFHGSDSESEFLLTLRHEVLHSTLGMLNLYTNMIEAVVGPENARGIDVIERARTFASEQMVRRLEMMMRDIPCICPNDRFQVMPMPILRNDGRYELAPIP
ncbi:MAG: hypothetical protein GY938_13135 [Ketobacter sp.]|nr:hypothetical protein [Ketobacter sp.]